MVVELGLHRVKEITIQDGGLLAGQDLALEDDLADIEPIAQKMGEWAAAERDTANCASGLERSHLGDDPPLAKVGHQQVEVAKLQISPKDGPDSLGLLLNHDDLAVPGRISEWRYAADPQALALGGRNLVADTLGGHLTLGKEGPKLLERVVLLTPERVIDADIVREVDVALEAPITRQEDALRLSEGVPDFLGDVQIEVRNVSNEERGVSYVLLDGLHQVAASDVVLRPQVILQLALGVGERDCFGQPC